MNKTVVLQILALILTLTAGSRCVQAVPSLILDLTSAGSEGWVDDALFQTSDLRSTGTGVIDAFVRILDATENTVQGYNTDGRPLEFDENNSPEHTEQLPLALVPIVYRTPEGGGADVAYYEFLLDINQKGAEGKDDDPDWNLSLDELQIAVQTSGDLLGYSTIFASPIYDLDSGPDGDTRIELNAKLNSGSGQGDMLAYIPQSLFPADPTGQYVYLYSLFGENGGYPNNGGFEEWAVQKGSGPSVTPAPDAVLLCSVGTGLVGWLRRRRSL